MDRESAIQNNSPTYESKSPCKVCSKYQRYVKNYGCTWCTLNRNVKRLELDPEYMKRYTKTEKSKTTRHKHVRSNQERYREIGKRSELLKKFGITLEQYLELAEKQNHQCAICLVPQEDLTKLLAVDHCHNTQKIRGLLCFKCNVGLGYFRDSPENIQRALEYITK